MAQAAGKGVADGVERAAEHRFDDRRCGAADAKHVHCAVEKRAARGRIARIVVVGHDGHGRLCLMNALHVLQKAPGGFQEHGVNAVFGQVQLNFSAACALRGENSGQLAEQGSDPPPEAVGRADDQDF